MPEIDFEKIPRFDARKLLPEGMDFIQYHDYLVGELTRYDFLWDRLHSTGTEESFAELIRFHDKFYGKFRILNMVSKFVRDCAIGPDASSFVDMALDVQLRMEETRGYREFISFLRGYMPAMEIGSQEGSLLDALCSVDGGRFSGYVMSERALMNHTLSPGKEKLLERIVIERNKHANTRRAVIRGLRFDMSIEGRHLRISSAAEIMNYFYGTEPAARLSAYEAYYGEHEKLKYVLFELVKGTVENYDWECATRNYKKPIDRMLLANDIPRNVYDTIMSVAINLREAFQAFLKYKSDKLGISPLRKCDTVASLGSPKIFHSFNEIANTSLDIMREASPDIAGIAERILREGRVDFEARQGKPAGGTCYLIGPRELPLIRTNYVGSINDHFNFFHEVMGHAAGFVMADNHPSLSYYASPPLHEGFALFAEFVGYHGLMRRTKDIEAGKAITAVMLDQAMSKSVRKAYGTLFEVYLHDSVGRFETVEEISSRWLEYEKELFGSNVEMHPLTRYGWLADSLMVERPFDGFMYIFGTLMGAALYGMYLEDGSGTVGRVKRMMSLGASKSLPEILREGGIDIYDRNFWELGMGQINKLKNDL